MTSLFLLIATIAWCATWWLQSRRIDLLAARVTSLENIVASQVERVDDVEGATANLISEVAELQDAVFNDEEPEIHGLGKAN